MNMEHGQVDNSCSSRTGDPGGIIDPGGTRGRMEQKKPRSERPSRGKDAKQNKKPPS